MSLDDLAGRITADPDRLQQVVWNLINNAVKFTDAGGRVLVGLRRLDESIQIIVTDTGKGISPEFLSQVFERFRQAEGSTTRKTGGLGLGLAITRQIVEAHGGTIVAESEGEGHGAKFTVTLPRARAQSKPIRRPKPDIRTRQPPPTTSAPLNHCQASAFFWLMMTMPTARR